MLFVFIVSIDKISLNQSIIATFNFIVFFQEEYISTTIFCSHIFLQIRIITQIQVIFIQLLCITNFDSIYITNQFGYAGNCSLRTIRILLNYFFQLEPSLTTLFINTYN